MGSRRRRDTNERDYVFGWLIFGIFTASGLKDTIFLKGGNALRKGYFKNTRFSSDLDFGIPGEVVTLAVLALFAWVYMTARAEPPSVDSGTNFLITAIMALILFILASFVTLRVAIDENYLRIKFGFGIFRKKFPRGEIASAKIVKNHWYYGWGIRLWLWPKMWIYNISGFDAVEIIMKNGKIYRIGTDEPEKLETAIRQAIHS